MGSQPSPHGNDENVSRFIVSFAFSVFAKNNVTIFLYYILIYNIKYKV